MSCAHSQSIYLAVPRANIEQLIEDLCPQVGDPWLWPACEMPELPSNHAIIELEKAVAGMTPERVAEIRVQWGRPEWMPVTRADLAWDICGGYPEYYQEPEWTPPAPGSTVSFSRFGLPVDAEHFDSIFPGYTDPDTGLWEPDATAVRRIRNRFWQGNKWADLIFCGAFGDMAVIYIHTGTHDIPPATASIVSRLPPRALPGMIMASTMAYDASCGREWMVKLPDKPLMRSRNIPDDFIGPLPPIDSHPAWHWVHMREAGLPEAMLELMFCKGLDQLIAELEVDLDDRKRDLAEREEEDLAFAGCIAGSGDAGGDWWSLTTVPMPII